MIKFGESGHPVSRATSPLSRGTLKSKGGGKLSIHFCADGETIETVFRTITFVNQLSIYGAVSDLCDKYRTCQVRMGTPVLAGQSDPLFEPASFVDDNTYTFDRSSCTRRFLAKGSTNEWKGLHNKIVWLKICTDAGFLTTVEVGQYFMTKDTGEFSQFTEPVACREYTLPKRWTIIWPERLDSREHQNWARVRSHKQPLAR